MINHEGTNEMVCPYCGYTHQNSWEASEGNRECANCEKVFCMSRDTCVFYTTEKVSKCDICGQMETVSSGGTNAGKFRIHSRVKDGQYVRCEGSRQSPSHPNEGG